MLLRLMLLTILVSPQSEGLTSLVKESKTEVTSNRHIEIASKLKSLDDNYWLVDYWVAYNYMAAYTMNKQSMDYLLNAHNHLQSNKVSSEIEMVLMNAWIVAEELQRAPLAKRKTLSQTYNDLLNKAEQIDKSNPRLHLLRGMQLYYTPPGLGGGKTKAIPYFKRAINLFADYSILSPLHPDWGLEQAKEMLNNCHD